MAKSLPLSDEALVQFLEDYKKSKDEEDRQAVIRNLKGSLDSKLDLSQLVLSQASKPIPEPIKFSTGTLAQFRAFIQDFESYCESKYDPASKERWAVELVKYLEGDLKSYVDTLEKKSRLYTEFKVQLEGYIDLTGSVEEEDAITKFISARLKSGESHIYFLLRLECLFQAAYPGEVAASSKTLVKRFLLGLSHADAIAYQGYVATLLSSGALNMWEQLKSYVKHISIFRESFASPKDDFVHPSPGSSQQVKTWFSHKTEPQGFKRPAAAFSKSVGNKTGAPKDSAAKELESPQSVELGENKRPYCRYCRFTGHTIESCWRRQRLCFHCKKVGHFRRNCPDLRDQPTNEVQDAMATSENWYRE